MFYKLKKRCKSESGQSMLEFILVFPLLMMLIGIMIDYGWLFYNQIQMENSARNAARVACVEYTDVCIDPETGNKQYENARQEFKIGSKSASINDVIYSDDLTDTEKKIINEVKSSLPGNLTDVSVFVEYTYDDDVNNGIYDNFNVENRSYGDVKVIIKATHRTIAPIFVAFGTESGNTRMERVIRSNSVYKVEKMYSNSGS